MTKINFTKEHFDKMCTHLMKMLLQHSTVFTKLGTPLNACELLHTTTINTLNDIRISLGKQIEKLENQDEWVADNYSQAQLDHLKEQKETVNLVIGYRRFTLENEEIAKKREELNAKLSELKEAQKSPDDKIKEIEEELNNLEPVDF